MMDIRDDQNHVFNLLLAKCSGIYQMLDPGTLQFRGKSVYHAVVALLTIYLCVIGTIFNVSGVYYWTNNMPLSADYFGKGIIFWFMCYSIWVIVHYSNDIWECLSITCYGLTSHSLRDRHILDRWRERSVFVTTILAFAYIMLVIIYFVASMALSNDILTVKNHDRSISNYRSNIFNLYLFASDDKYNAHYNMFYIVEVLCLVAILIAYFVFDILEVTLCFAVSCQMQMICTAFESVGYTSLGHHLSLVDCRGEKKKLPNKQNKQNYDELKIIIIDHQAVMKKYGAILTIFKRVLLSQIVVFSMVFILLWFCFIMSFSNDERFKCSRILTIKVFCGIPSTMLKLFGTCYLFGNIHDHNDSIIFALYSSNWTDLDMKCKKLILFTMKMNNANQKKLKFTRTKIVNLEMFFKTMGDSYSILSVLINYIKNMEE